MKITTVYSVEKNPVSAVKEATDELLSKTETKPQFVMASWTSSYNGQSIVETLRSCLGEETQIVGATSCMGIMTENGFHSDNGSAFGLISFSDEQSSFGVGGAIIADSPREAGSAAVNEAIQNAGRIGEMPDLLWLSAPPGSEEEIILGIEAVVGKEVPLFGGSAGDNTIQGEWLLLANEKTGSELVTVSAFYLASEFSYSFHSGYLPTLTRGVATSAENRVVYMIDGKPAADVYNDWTGQAIAAHTSGGNILADTSLHPIGRQVGTIGEVPYYRLSHPSAVQQNHSLEFFSNIEEGDELVLMTGTEETLVSRAGRVAGSALDLMDPEQGNIAGALVVYCAGCMLTVQSRMDEVVEGIRSTIDSPFLGVFTFGEQGCFLGGENKHGNLMISTIVFKK